VSALHKFLDLVLPAKGVHRGARAVPAPERIPVRLAGLATLPPPRFPAVPHGAVAVQAFRHCPRCGRDVPVILHAGGAHSCDRGHLTIPSHRPEGAL
jgi:hypothetical protein